jgi:electron transport complex protein RnfG
LNKAKIPVKITPGTIRIDKAGKSVYYPIFRVDSGKQLAGWVVKASGQGYSGSIELLLGLDPRAALITGLFILEQKETPGLGNKIASAHWRNQFVHKKTAQPLMLSKGGRGEQATGGNAIDAVTGATISSRAVTDIVNGIVSDTRGNLTSDHIRYFERQG